MSSFASAKESYLVFQEESRALQNEWETRCRQLDNKLHQEIRALRSAHEKEKHLAEVQYKRSTTGAKRKYEEVCLNLYKEASFHKLVYTSVFKPHHKRSMYVFSDVSVPELPLVSAVSLCQQLFRLAFHTKDFSYFAAPWEMSMHDRLGPQVDTCNLQKVQTWNVTMENEVLPYHASWEREIATVEDLDKIQHGLCPFAVDVTNHEEYLFVVEELDASSSSVDNYQPSSVDVDSQSESSQSESSQSESSQSESCDASSSSVPVLPWLFEQVVVRHTNRSGYSGPVASQEEKEKQDTCSERKDSSVVQKVRPVRIYFLRDTSMSNWTKKFPFLSTPHQKYWFGKSTIPAAVVSELMDEDANFPGSFWSEEEFQTHVQPVLNKKQYRPYNSCFEECYESEDEECFAPTHPRCTSSFQPSSPTFSATSP